MAKVTNNSEARQGVWFSGELKWIEPGESYEGDMTDAEAKLILTDMLAVDGAPADSGSPKLPGLTGKSKDDLLAIAAAEGVTTFTSDDGNDKPIADGTKNDIVAAIEAKRDPA